MCLRYWRILAQPFHFLFKSGLKLGGSTVFTQSASSCELLVYRTPP